MDSDFPSSIDPKMGSDVANDTLSSSEFQEQFGGGAGGQKSLERLGRPVEVAEAALAIDPGTTTGLAWAPIEGQRLLAAKSSFWELVEALAKENIGAALTRDVEMPPAEDVLVILEAPYKSRQSMGAQAAIAYNSGQVAREAELAAGWIEESPYQLVEVDPAGQGGKWGRSKAEQIVGSWVGHNNEHTRDAIRMLYQHGVI